MANNSLYITCLIFISLDVRPPSIKKLDVEKRYLDGRFNPSITVGTKLTVVRGVSVTIHCPIKSKYAFEIKWEILGKSETPSNKVTSNENMTAITVKDLSEDDTGKYTCYASNNAGSDSATSTITVLGKLKNLLVSGRQYFIDHYSAS